MRELAKVLSDVAYLRCWPESNLPGPRPLYQVGYFLFHGRGHETGYDVQVWILHPDGERLEIIHQANLGLHYRMPDWEHYDRGPWDVALAQAVDQLEAAIHKAKAESAARTEAAQKESDRLASERKARFAELFKVQP